MQKLVTPFRVGLLMIASLAILFVSISFVKKGGLSTREGLTVHAYFQDASGLGKKSRVQIAGILVGEIRSIELVGMRAKVTMRVRREARLREDAALTKRSESLLGDFMLDLFPGTDAAPLLEEGGEIRIVKDRQGMEQVLDQFTKISQDVRSVTASLREVLGGDRGADSLRQIVENLVRLSEAVDQSVKDSSARLLVILDDFSAVSGEARRLAEREGGAVEEIIADAREVARDVREILATAKRIVGAGDEDLRESAASLKEVLGRLDRTLENVEAVTAKVREGKGAAGALLTDERLGQRLQETIDGVSDYAGRLVRLKTEVQIKSEYLAAQRAAKNTLGLRLIPRPDKYYLVELVDDPRGVVETQVVESEPPSAGDPGKQVQRVTKEGMKVSVELAKRFYFATFRLGLIESTGGLGADFHVLNDALSLRLDAFNFRLNDVGSPRLRAAVRFEAFEHLFASVGVDDFLNTPERDALTRRTISGRDFFAGGGVFFTDDDLKAVLSAAPVPTVK